MTAKTGAVRRHRGALHGKAQQLGHHALGGQFHVEPVIIDDAAEITVQHQRRNGDDQAERRVV